MKKSFKYNLKKLVVLMLVVTFVCFNIVALTGCDNDEKNKEFDNTYIPPIYNDSGEDKQAIIVLPGIFASNLINAETNEPLWSGGALLNNLFMTNYRLTKDQISNYFKTFLYKDENGKSVVPIRAATMHDQYLQYGLIDEYRNMYKFLNSKFNDKDLEDSKKYEIVIYQYDWTKSAKDSAKDLQTFIDINRYKNNILIGHSLGGLVCDHYLASSEQNRTNTKGFISLGTPHFGTMDSVMLAFGDLDFDVNNTSDLIDLLKLTGLDMGSGSMKDINEMIDAIMDSFDGLNIMDKIPEEYVPQVEEGKELTPLETMQALMPFANDIITDVLSYVRTMPSLYDLLPSEELFNNNVKIDNNVISYTDFFAKVKQTPNVKANPQIATLIDNSINDRKSLYINGTFISDAFTKNNVCKTVYIAGNGKAKTLTTSAVNFTTKANDLKLYVKPNNTNITLQKSYHPVKSTVEGKEFINYIPEYKGDGFVLINSATANNLKGKQNVVYLEGFYGHKDLITPLSPSEDLDIISFMMPNEIGKAIFDKINNYIELYA